MHLGQVISGKYRLVRLLGDGGMGSVYEAHHEKLGTRVAIKFLHVELARHAGLVDRFLQEARVAAQIRSPHVVHVTDIDQSDGLAYIVMDLLEGEPLSSVLERERKMPVPIACEYTRQILEALEAAHALGVVHRDLKPENVFVTFASGKPDLKLIDFGIAKLRREGPAQKNLTVAGVLMGTAEYMAPEQAFSADKVDGRSDIYSVGVMLYEMIAGVRPVSGEDARVIAMKVEKGEVTPLVHVAPDVPREIAGLAHRAMAARPELRFASAAEMRLALEGALSGKRPPTAALPVQPAPPIGPQAAALAMAAGTGTVMGAPAEALLGAHGTPAPAVQQFSGGSTAKVTPVSVGLASPAPYMDAPPSPPPRRSSKGLVVAMLLIATAAIGAIVVSQTDLLSGLGGSATADPPAPPPAPPPPPPAVPPPPAPGVPPAPPGSLAPLVTPPIHPGPTPGPTPHPKPSGGGSSSGGGGAPPMPSFPPFPFPIPSGPQPVFTIPTVMPSFPIPIPGFTPPSPGPAPPPAPQNGPDPAPSVPGY